MPCGDKPEEEKIAIRELGERLPDLDVTIYVSRRMLKAYKSKVIPLLSKHHPLPPLQAWLVRTIRWIVQLKKCKTVCARGLQSSLSVRIHVLETKWVERYDVRGLGLKDEEDMEVLRVALATGHGTLLVSTNRHFLEDLRLHELRARYPDEGGRLRVVRPSELLRELEFPP